MRETEIDTVTDDQPLIPPTPAFPEYTPEKLPAAVVAVAAICFLLAPAELIGLFRPMVGMTPIFEILNRVVYALFFLAEIAIGIGLLQLRPAARVCAIIFLPIRMMLSIGQGIIWSQSTASIYYDPASDGMTAMFMMGHCGILLIGLIISNILQSLPSVKVAFTKSPRWKDPPPPELLQPAGWPVGERPAIANNIAIVFFTLTVVDLFLGRSSFAAIIRGDQSMDMFFILCTFNLIGYGLYFIKPKLIPKKHNDPRGWAIWALAIHNAVVIPMCIVCRAKIIGSSPLADLSPEGLTAIAIAFFVLLTLLHGIGVYFLTRPSIKAAFSR